MPSSTGSWRLTGDGPIQEVRGPSETSAHRAAANLGTRAFFALLGPLVGYGIDAWGLPSVLSALGILFSIAFAFLLLPLALRETAPSPADRAGE